MIDLLSYYDCQLAKIRLIAQESVGVQRKTIKFIIKVKLIIFSMWPINYII